MGSFSIWHWMVVLLVVLLLFGSGKVSNLMGRFRQGHKIVQEKHGRARRRQHGSHRRGQTGRDHRAAEQHGGECARDYFGPSFLSSEERRP